MAAYYGGLVYFKVGAGAWVQESLPVGNWSSVKCSGNTRIAARYGGLVYVNVGNAGWVAQSFPGPTTTGNWFCVALSTDETTLMAGNYTLNLFVKSLGFSINRTYATIAEVTLSGGNISNVSTTSNYIGGVTLSGGTVLASTISAGKLGLSNLTSESVNTNLLSINTTTNEISYTNKYVKGITAGTGITISPAGPGATGVVTITATGGGGTGTVTSVTSANANITVANGTTTPQLTLNNNLSLTTITTGTGSSSIGGVTLNGGTLTSVTSINAGGTTQVGGVTFTNRALTNVTSINTNINFSNVGNYVIGGDGVPGINGVPSIRIYRVDNQAGYSNYNIEAVNGGTLAPDLTLIGRNIILSPTAGAVVASGVTLNSGALTGVASVNADGNTKVGGVTFTNQALSSVTTINANSTVKVANINMRGNTNGNIWLCPDSSAEPTQAGNNIAIGGTNTGKNQSANAIAIGAGAGASSTGTQGTGAIAIGESAASAGQSSGAIAIGKGSGNSGTGLNAVALGINAIASGQSSIAIGANAGASGTASRTIVINATGGDINTTYSTQTDSLFVAPIRNGTTESATRNLAYNSTTKEIVHRPFGLVIASGSIDVLNGGVRALFQNGCTVAGASGTNQAASVSFTNAPTDSNYCVNVNGVGLGASYAFRVYGKSTIGFAIACFQLPANTGAAIFCDFVVIR